MIHPMCTFFNVKLDNHTPCIYNVQTKNGEQKMQKESFEVATSSNTKL
jgi:hypothetical protein